MRRAVTTVMSGLSVVVVGVGLRASENFHKAALASAPAGVVSSTIPVTKAAPTPKVAAATAPPTAAPTRTATSVVATRPAGPVVVATHPPSPTPRPKPTPTSVTVNGQPADTRYGPVQVQITVRGGKIIRADAINYPQESSQDQQINSYAIPQLDSETLQAQSSQIDSVSGATYTSDGYINSLQSAIDAAHAAGAL